MFITYTNQEQTIFTLAKSYSNFSFGFPLQPTAGTRYAGQSFRPDCPVILNKSTFDLTYVGSPVTNMVSKIYAHTGIYGSTGKPTGSPLAISDVVNAADIPGDGFFTTYRYISDSYSESNNSYSWNLSGTDVVETTIDSTTGYIGGVSADTTDEAFATVFNVASEKVLTSIDAYLGRFNPSVQVLYAKIYAITGTVGVNALPTGAALATSDEFNATILLGSSPVGTPSNFVFSGVNQITLTPGNYALVIEMGVGGQWFWDATSTDAGYSSYYNSGSWTTFAVRWKYTIYGAPTTNTYEGVGQIFTNTNEVSITQAKFYLKKVGSPTGSAYATLYSVPAGGGVPIGILAISDAFDVSTLTTSFALTTFSFTGTEQVTMNAATEYGILLTFTDGSTGNYIVAGSDKTSATDPDNFLLDTDGVIAYDTPAGTFQLCYYVYGDSTTDYGGSVSGTNTWNLQTITFNFTGSNQISLDENTDYFVVIDSGDSSYDSDYVILSVGLSSLPSGNAATSDDASTWTATAILAFNFAIYGNNFWEEQQLSQQTWPA